MSVTKVNKLLRSQVFHWSKKVSIAILDQVLFNGVHFLIAVLLARWLVPVEYGIFAVAYSIFLLLAAFHMALLVEPMLIFGAGKYRGIFRSYLGTLISGNFIITIFGSLTLFLIGFPIGFFYSKSLQAALFGLSIAIPFILLLWLLRRSFYVRLEPGWSVIGGMVYTILLLAVSILLKKNHLLSPATYFLSMGLCSLLVSLPFICIIHPVMFKLRKTEVLEIRRDHFCYGKWALGTNVLSWVMSNIYFVILPVWIGFEGVAGLRALMNLSTPIIQTNGALSFLLLPILSRHRLLSIEKLKITTVFFLVTFIFSAIIYLLGLIIFGNIVMSFLYGNQYLEFYKYVPLIAILPLGVSIQIVLENSLRALGRAKDIFWIYVLLTIFVLIGGITLTIFFGIKGALFGYLISYFIICIAMYISYRK